MEHNGYKYYCQRKVEETNSAYWISARHRAGCRARLIVRDELVRARNDHTCREEMPQEVKDVRREMRLALQAACLANLSVPPGMVWEQVMTSLRQEYPEASLNTIARQPAISIIKCARAQVTGGDALRAIESAPLCHVGQDDARPFLQFSVVHTIGCGQHRFLGFGHPDLIRLLRYSGTAIYIDGTFKMVSKPFTQCLIVMVRDPGVDLYVPAVYVLMDSKHQEAYWYALNCIIIQTGRLLEPASVTCDFERGLINAVVEQLPLVKIVGCLFYWKQSLRRKMIEQRIPLDQIAAALRPGVIDVLTVIPVDEISDNGVRYVRSLMDETGAKVKWNAFWRYFKNTWLTSYSADLWNVNSMADAGIDLQNRTNNPLERYNRAFGELLSVEHPSLHAFVETTKADSRRYVQMIEDIKQHRRQPPTHAPYVETRIPVDYTQFE